MDLVGLLVYILNLTKTGSNHFSSSWTFRGSWCKVIFRISQNGVFWTTMTLISILIDFNHGKSSTQNTFIFQHMLYINKEVSLEFLSRGRILKNFCVCESCTHVLKNRMSGFCVNGLFANCVSFIMKSKFIL